MQSVQSTRAHGAKGPVGPQDNITHNLINWLTYFGKSLKHLKLKAKWEMTLSWPVSVALFKLQIAIMWGLWAHYKVVCSMKIAEKLAVLYDTDISPAFPAELL